MNNNDVNRLFFAIAFALGLVAVMWIGAGFVGTSALALVMTIAIAAVYLMGAQEVRRFRASTAALGQALADVPQPLAQLGDWIGRVPPALQAAVRARIEGERGALPGLALTPYLVGLLVMLGMLGTFLGLVVTFRGAVFTLEGTADLQAIRSALAAPIKGLGLAFGTSVVGVATSAMLGKIQQGNDVPGRKSASDRGNTIYTVSAAEAQEFRRKARTVEVEWVEDMNKKGFDGKKLLDTARSLIEKHTKTTKA